MASVLFDSIIYRDSWGTKEMRQIFDEKQMLQRWLDIEVALAEVEADLGIIPKEAAIEFKKKANVDLLDMEFMQKKYEETGHSLMPLLNNFKDICDNELGEYVHWGPTTQDIADTGMVMALNEAVQIIWRDIIDLEDSLMKLALKHKLTLMAGRTHGQQAQPTTFGVKVAVWLREVSRHIQRLEESMNRLLVINLCGGVGNYASFKGKGIYIEKNVAEKLGLSISDAPWHTARDRFAEFGHLLSMIGTTCGKIGNEVYELQKTEIGELIEPNAPGQIGSSTMPHKRNPEIAEALNGLSKVSRHLSSLISECMLVEHERDGAAWKPEWIAIPQICLVTGTILEKIKFMVEGLGVDESRMKENLGLLKGLILSERVMLALAEKLGKLKAHGIVHDIAMRFHNEGLDFKEGLKCRSEVAENFSDEEIDHLLDASTYIGQSEEIVDRAIQITEIERSKRGTNQRITIKNL
ncbi:MAG: adenylosuccinate lyase [Bacillota bacterium]|nr:adenylosuccinate lyase [Bacillota bacterium]